MAREDPPGRRPSRGELAAALAIVALAFALRAPLLTRGFEYDEIWTTIDFVEAPSAWQTISRVKEFNNHPLYSLLARGAEAAFGRSEWAVRVPALLFGLAALPALWLALRRRCGPPTALLASLALASSSVHIGWSVSARGYTGLVLFSWLSSALFLRLLREGGGSARVSAYAAATAFGIWMHLHAGAVLAVHAVVIAILATRELRAGGRVAALARVGAAAAAALGAGLLAALCYAPALPRLVPRLLAGSASAFDPRLPLRVMTYLVGLDPDHHATAGLLLAAVPLAGLAVGLRRRPLEALTVALLFAVPIGGVWLARPEFVRPRFFVFLLPFVALGFAIALESVWRAAGRAAPGGRRAAARLAAAAAIAAAAWLWASDPRGNVPTGGFREAAAALDAPASDPAKRVGRCAIGIGARFYEWYAAQPILIPGSVDAFEAFAAQHDEVRCAYMRHANEPPEHTRIGALLESRCALDGTHFVIRTWRCAR